MLPDYAELHCLTNFTFLRGASHPEELIQHAQQLGYRALAVTDECSLSGVVRAHTKLKECNTVSGQTRLIIGSEFTLDTDVKFVLLAMDRIGYGQLCELITMARRAASKGSYCLTYEDLFDRQLDACICLWCPGKGLNTSSQIDIGDTLKQHFNDRIWIAVELLMQNTDGEWLEYS